jgi:hypothetical protein
MFVPPSLPYLFEVGLKPAIIRFSSHLFLLEWALK